MSIFHSYLLLLDKIIHRIERKKMLKQLSEEVALHVCKSYFSSKDSLTTEELFKEMFDQQPIFEYMVKSVLEDDSKNDEFKEGYCMGIFQCWHMLNQQYMIENFEN